MSNQNRRFTAFASAARTATPTAFFGRNPEGKGIIVVIDVTAVTSTPSTTFTISGIDPTSGKTYTILASAALATTGTITLRVYPGLTAAANLTVSDVLPLHYTIAPVHGNANSMTYSVGVQVIV